MALHRPLAQHHAVSEREARALATSIAREVAMVIGKQEATAACDQLARVTEIILARELGAIGESHRALAEAVAQLAAVVESRTLRGRLRRARSWLSRNLFARVAPVTSLVPAELPPPTSEAPPA